MANSSLRQILTSTDGLFIYSADWRVTITPNAFFITNLKKITFAQGQHLTRITTPFTISSLFSETCNYVGVYSQNDMLNILHHYIFVVEPFKLTDRYNIVNSIIVNFDTNIGLLLETNAAEIDPQELNFYVSLYVPMLPADVSALVSNEIGKMQPTLFKAYGLKKSPVNGTTTVEGVAVQTRPNTYELLFDCEDMTSFFAAKFFHAYECVGGNTEKTNALALLAQNFAICKIHGNTYKMSIEVEGIPQPPTIKMSVCLATKVNPGQIVLPSYVRHHTTPCFGWTLPLYAKCTVELKPHETCDVPLDGLFMKGTNCTRQIVCLVGGPNENDKLMIHPTVWFPMTALCVSVTNTTNDLLTIPSGYMLALAIPAVMDGLRHGVAFGGFSDFGGNPIFWSLPNSCLEKLPQSASKDALKILTEQDFKSNLPHLASLAHKLQ
ncbi:hypothetical protein KM481_gp10 [Harp seal herpesvirus]|uniref:Uncharacterized protein n=1 Tax=phocid gammaherpesvirus 3 TaxID=2560643 RepID=A0A0R5ZDQ8_9GAMA|nr:hypothetical protein KM481_gp10 [Harp seal herpesvirus]AJG42940.1 hypothetical protein [Harp seal herpesvirus]